MACDDLNFWLSLCQAGEKLLVLGASGGVGMAAVDIGQALGAEVS